MPALNVTIGPRPNAPRPHLEAPLARRTAIVALAFILASALHFAAYGITLGQFLRAFPLYALGGFAILIFGTSRLLLAGMAGRDVVGGARTSLVVTVGAAVGAAGLYLARDAAPWSLVFALVWGAAAATHVVVIAQTARRSPAREPILDPTARPSTRLPRRALELGSLGYGALAALLVPTSYAGLAARPAMLHEVLVGFVITTIMAVATNILPRFTRVGVPPAPFAALAVLALAGPALVMVGLDHGGPALVVGAVVEGLAFAVFGAIVLTLLVRAHRLRPVHAVYAAAPLAIGVGGLVALAYVTRGALGEQLAAHALLNVFGFAGLFVLAASADLYGPALAPGAKPAQRHVVVAAVLSLAGLLVAAAGTWVGADVGGRAGMALYAAAVAWQIGGIVASHLRAERVVTRLR